MAFAQVSAGLNTRHDDFRSGPVLRRAGFHHLPGLGLSRFDRVETLGFDYGQRHRIELEARPPILAALAKLPHGERLGADHLLPLDTLKATAAAP